VNTLPMPLDALDTFGARPGGLDDFRITAAREIHATLRQLQDGSVPLHLNGCGGHSVVVTVWSVDTDGGGWTLCLNSRFANTSAAVGRILAPTAS